MKADPNAALDVSNESKCACQRCGQHIAFPNVMRGQDINCPHCGRETTLAIPFAHKTEVAAPAPAISERAILCGYVLAALMPLIGFLMGIYFMTKNRSASGLVCIGMSIICGLIWLAVLNQP